MEFIREASLIVNLRKEDFSGYYRTIEIKDLRISFSILKSLAWSTNSSVIRVWNLSSAHRNAIKDYGDQVILSAGYQRAEGQSILYVGDTTAVSHIFDQPDIVSVFECGDGDRYINQSVFVVSYSSNAPARLIVQDIAKKMGIPNVEFANSDNLIFRQGYSDCGMAKDMLTNVCNKLGLQWSVQNSNLQIIPQTGTIVQQPIIINEDTGMQGIPQRFTFRRTDMYRPVVRNPTQVPTAPQVPPSQPSGYKVNVALKPEVLPGSPIVLQSTHLNFKGTFRVDNVRHEGDTWGPIWSSQMEVTEVVTTPT